MSKKKIIPLILLSILGFGFYGAAFTVFETEQAIVLQFGNPKRTITEPGLHFKTPFLQQVIYMDRRILNLDVPEQEVITSDQKRLVVDAIARFRIIDPLLTYQSSQNAAGARERLATILVSNVRRELGSEPFATMLTGERARLMTEIRDSVNEESASLGLEVVDVRIRRLDLPEANSQAIFQRMQTEREREAQEARAKGREQAVRIRAGAERERTVLLADAEMTSSILRGEGDGEAVKIFADAFTKDEDFYEFYRSMQAYRNALNKDDTTLVLSPDSEFFKYFGVLGGGKDKR